MNRHTKNYFFIGLIVLYAFTFFFILFALLSMPNSYNKLQVQSYKEAKASINDAIEHNSSAATFEELYEKYLIEFIIYNETTDTFVFMSVPIEDPSNLKSMLNEKAIGKEEIYKIQHDTNEFSIWLAQYNISPQSIVDQWLIYIVTAILSLFTLVLLAIGYVAIKVIRPLKILRENIYKMSSYQLEHIIQDSDHDDVLSHELQTFSRDLMNRIESAEITYTSLEKELKLENETAIYRSNLLATLSHDLKSPLHLSQIQIEEVLDSNHQLTPDERAFLENAASKNAAVLEDINSLIKTVFQKDIAELNTITTFDLIPLISDVSQLFIPQMTIKNFDVDISTDSSILFTGNYIRMKQLIQNAFANIVTHATNDATVLIECYVENEHIYLTFYNDASPLTNEQLARIFDLFYHTDTSHLSTGLGLFSIKQIAKEHNGNATFINDEDGVKLICSFTETD